MRLTTLEGTLHTAPFRPFELHTDGRTIPVLHPEQVMITPDKSTVVVAPLEGGVCILDLDRISLLTVKSRARRTSAK
ncbi:MAG: hypothetical protein HY043_19160 [Verrucomicrobia bacterium]|nr:hypothetical protein [Verrucomicrobiota bacterium]